MKKTDDLFIEIVRKSRALSSEQKELLLEDPVLSVTFLKHIVKTLELFDTHSKVREAYLRQKLDASLAAFSRELDVEGIDETTKSQLLMKAKQLNAQFFSV